MLYQTHHSQYFFFQVQSSTTTTTTQPKASPLSSSPVKEMEGVLKSGFRKETVGCEDDMWTTTTTTTTTTINSQKGVSLDEFSVDDLLDFSNEDGLIEQEHTQNQTQEGENKNQSLSMTTTTEEKETQHKEDHKDEIFNFDDLGPIPVGDLAVPVDDVANLEWLSHFVEDSFSEYAAPFPAGAMPLKPKEKGSEPETPVLKTKACFRSPVPAKARSKRSRSGCRVWSLGSPPSMTDSSSGSTSPGSTTSPPSPLLIYANHPGSVCVEPTETVSWEKKPPAKRPRKKVVAEGAGDGDGYGGATSGSSTKLERRCSHCAVHKTPQWRTGPYGPKTLCNACGVRYKSGRLLPEYRPACSPTFSSERHSNHHRKVLEMRRQKEMLGQAEPGLAAQVVPSF